MSTSPASGPGASAASIVVVPDHSAQSHAAAGLAMGVAAYLWWGVVTALYLRTVRHVPTLEVLAHRALWSAVILVPVLLAVPAMRAQIRLLQRPVNRWRLAVTTVLIAANWLTFIHAVNTKKLLDASLGYYIIPLVSVAFGRVFLGEKLSRAQACAIALAALAAGLMVASVGSLPWIAAVLACTFACYSLMRKTDPFGPVAGLALENAILAPIAIATLTFFAIDGRLAFDDSPRNAMLLALGGVVTIVPLGLFTAAAKRLRFGTIGLLQYISPTGQFLLAVAVFNERQLQPIDLMTFGLVWAALAIYAVDGLRRRPGSPIPRRRTAAPDGPESASPA